MQNLLVVESAQLGADIASIITNSILTIVLIVVTVILGVQNDRISQKSVYLPLRIELCKLVSDYSKEFYGTCTKLINNRASLSLSDFETSIAKLDDLNTAIFDAKLRVKSIFPKETIFWNTLNELFKAAEQLQERMKEGKDIIIVDFKNLDEELKHFSYTNLMEEIFNNEEKYNLLTKKLTPEMVAFLNSYKCVFNILDKEIDYISFIRSKE